MNNTGPMALYGELYSKVTLDITDTHFRLLYDNRGP
jgi:hypothetical protein